MKLSRVREIVAALSALWLIAAFVVVSARIQSQVDATRAIEAELSNGVARHGSPGFFDVARVMLQYGSWQLAELGGVPAATLIFIGASTMIGRRQLRITVPKFRRDRTARFPSLAKRI